MLYKLFLFVFRCPKYYKYFFWKLNALLLAYNIKIYKVTVNLTFISLSSFFVNVGVFSVFFCHLNCYDLKNVSCVFQHFKNSDLPIEDLMVEKIKFWRLETATTLKMCLANFNFSKIVIYTTKTRIMVEKAKF